MWLDFYNGYSCSVWLQQYRKEVVIKFLFMKYVETVQWIWIWRARIACWIVTWEQVAAAQSICWGFPLGMAIPVSSVSEWSRPQDSPLLHFPAVSLRPQLTGSVINSVKTALCYLLCLKVMFIDWNFPELIWPNVKFSIHTWTPVN